MIVAVLFLCIVVSLAEICSYQTHINPSVVSKKPLWVYIWNAPAKQCNHFMELCFRSLTLNRGSFEIFLIHKNNFKQYFDEESLKQVHIAKIKKSSSRRNYIMLRLLERYGGAALDGTTILYPERLDAIWERMRAAKAEFFSFINSPRGYDKRLVVPWFMMATPKSKILALCGDQTRALGHSIRKRNDAGFGILDTIVDSILAKNESRLVENIFINAHDMLISRTPSALRNIEELQEQLLVDNICRTASSYIMGFKLLTESDSLKNWSERQLRSKHDSLIPTLFHVAFDGYNACAGEFDRILLSEQGCTNYCFNMALDFRISNDSDCIDANLDTKKSQTQFRCNCEKANQKRKYCGGRHISYRNSRLRDQNYVMSKIYNTSEGLLEEIEDEIAFLFANNSYVHEMEAILEVEIERWHNFESGLTPETLTSLVPMIGSCLLCAVCVFLSRAGYFGWVREELEAQSDAMLHVND